MQILCNHLILDLSTPKVMGIINLTPDSFYDGGKYLSEQAWMARAAQLIEEGAQILDIGAASSRPGSELIGSDDEWKILENPIRQLRKIYPRILISVDTYNAGLVSLCADLGVNIINDISGGSWDNQMFAQVAKSPMAYVMMHIQGQPANMQQNPQYINVMDELKDYFKVRLEQLRMLDFQKIIIDPGFGFGKTLEHNYKILARMNELNELGFPVLAGLSRKSMIFRPLNISPEQSLNGTTALNMLALQQGANILRVHDVKEAVETIRLFTLFRAGS
jgi:dihydropteroate synthase